MSLQTNTIKEKCAVVNQMRKASLLIPLKTIQIVFIIRFAFYLIIIFLLWHFLAGDLTLNYEKVDLRPPSYGDFYKINFKLLKHLLQEFLQEWSEPYKNENCFRTTNTYLSSLADKICFNAIVINSFVFKFCSRKCFPIFCLIYL